MAELVERHMVSSTRGAKAIGLWMLQIATAGMFFFAGGSKLAGAAAMVGLFDVIGVGQWFRYLTGGLEVLGGVLLLIPALAGLGAVLLLAVMIGAVATHVSILHSPPTAPAILLVAMAIVAWSRREEIRRTLHLE